MKVLSDRHKNEIFATRGSHSILLELKLADENRRRMIGSIDTNQRVLDIARNRGKHLYRKMNAYGLNDHIIRHAKLFDTVRIADEFGVYLLDREWILKNGKHLFHKKQGFELQIFVTIEQMKS